VAGIGAPELIIVLVIVLVIFGGAKLPKLARSLGEAKKEFEASAKDEADETDTKKTA
jgi:sec-independent protein translocase protein TatA